MDANMLKKRAYDEIEGIFKMMAYAGVSMYVITFRMKELMQEYNISNLEIDMLRREVLYQINFLNNPI
jgi:hypothetical protein